MALAKVESIFSCFFIEVFSVYRMHRLNGYSIFLNIVGSFNLFDFQYYLGLVFLHGRPYFQVKLYVFW